MKIAVCTTLAAYVMDDVGTWASWLLNAREVKYSASEVDATLHYFAAIEIDERSVMPFTPLMSVLHEDIQGEWWTYSLDDGRTTITTENRLRHLTMGQNICVEYATSIGADWLLFLAADTQPPDDVIPRLLEVRYPLVGCELPTYCLNGVPVPGYDFPVHDQLISAACIFIRRDVFKVLRWRNDADSGMTDDPAYRHDAYTLLGIREYVRKDCRARHYPESICAIESRFPGRDLRVYR